MLIVIGIGAFLSNFTIGSMNVALPGLADAFGTTLGNMQWTVIGYLLMLTILLPVMGKLADRFGIRRVHNLGYAAFAITSILVATASSVELLVIARLLQGAAASMYQSTNLGLVSIHFPVHERGRAMGWISLAVAAGAVSGPLAGGMAMLWLSWHWLFVLPALIMAGTFVLAGKAIPKDTGQASNPLDIVGGVWFTLALAASITSLAQGHAWGWVSPAMLSLIAIALLAGWLFVHRTLRQPFPFLPVQVMLHPAVRSGLTVSALSFAAANAALVSIPAHLASMAGDQAFIAGLTMALYPITMACAGPIAGRLSDRYGSMPFTKAGMGILTLAMGLLILASGGATWALITGLIMAGLGMGIMASPTIRLIMNEVPQAYKGSIGGVLALARNMGIVVGSSLGLGLSDGTNPLFLPMVAACSLGLFGLGMLGWSLPSGQGERAGDGHRSDGAVRAAGKRDIL
ncbi:MFS transporter [Paenibacillus daejeonensis]|uniref:MFS transporter n=1 Tax=Paenibacillus daejeonensis TaxID=135193 RepID=UPI0003A73A38|nr:MFS transporter [Paenibacillus daejeonensis]